MVLLALFFWAYEAFSLWDSPRWTAWIVIGYFVAAFAIDGLFRGASFCKYLCPDRPVQLRPVARLAAGGEGPGRGRLPVVPDEGLHPRRRRRASAAASWDCTCRGRPGNLDCTFCLDCVHACPHENVGILAVAPGRDLWNEASRSGIGRLEDRPDLAALILVLVFGAFANAGGMVGPGRRPGRRA